MIKKSNSNRKIVLFVLIILAAVYLLGLFIWGMAMPDSAIEANFNEALLAPQAGHIFGTDSLGRDMLFRCVKGMTNSLAIGLVATGISTVIAFILGVCAALFGGFVDKLINLAIDLCMGLPHIVLLILISCVAGRGLIGVTIAVSLTHWPSLSRIVRQEVLEIKNTWYVKAATQMGKSPVYIATNHMAPHVMPSLGVGAVLLFPHAIMHEAAITFLGFGLPKEMPAIGVILSESMSYITLGKWWLTLFPGVMLFISILLFDLIGGNLKKLVNPESGNE